MSEHGGAFGVGLALLTPHDVFGLEMHTSEQAASENGHSRATDPGSVTPGLCEEALYLRTFIVKIILV